MAMRRRSSRKRGSRKRGSRLRGGTIHEQTPLEIEMRRVVRRALLSSLEYKQYVAKYNDLIANASASDLNKVKYNGEDALIEAHIIMCSFGLPQIGPPKHRAESDDDNRF